MVDIQVQTLNEIDEKAAKTARLIAVLLGLTLTGASLVPQLTPLSFDTSSGVLVASLGIGLGSLLLSLGFAVVTYLSSRFLYGPTEYLGWFLSEYSVPRPAYRHQLLGGYHTAIQANKYVVRVNSRRFRNSLTALLVGLLYLSLGTVHAVLDPQPVVAYASLAASTAAAVLVAVYLVREEYLAIGYEGGNNEW